MGLFQNKIRVGFEYYLKKKGKDMITSLLVPQEYGIENMPVNGGSMNNSGWELSVSFTCANKEFYLGYRTEYIQE